MWLCLRVVSKMGLSDHCRSLLMVGFIFKLAVMGGDSSFKIIVRLQVEV